MALGLALAMPYLRGGSAWMPAELFGASEPGIAYDLTDSSKLYQDSARTTLVAANGDPIGSVTDISGNGKHASQATTASKPLWQGYGDLDGVDDSWATAAIDFTGTNKVTVVVGVRKLSDASAGVLVELGATVGNPGTFTVFAPDSPNTYAFYLNGSAIGARAAGGYAPPTTNVLSCVFDIGGATLVDEIKPRVDGVVPALSAVVAGPAGTGNFSNAALNIGRRNGTSLPLNGRIYRMIVIGRALTATELANAERWCAAPAGVVLP